MDLSQISKLLTRFLGSIWGFFAHQRAEARKSEIEADRWRVKSASQAFEEERRMRQAADTTDDRSLSDRLRSL